MTILFLTLIFIMGALDGTMDRLREVHQLLAESGHSEWMITPNKNWFSYSPMRKGLIRDGWHGLKFVLRFVTAIALAITPSILFENSFTQFLFIAGSAYIAQWLGFWIFLSVMRKRITVDNNFKL